MTTDGWYIGTGNNGGSVTNASCSGKLTWTWTWTGSGTPPSAVTLKVEAKAGWGSGVGGACDDGLGDTPVYTHATPSDPTTPIVDGRVSGVRWVQAKVVSGTVTYEISPSASCPNVAGCQAGSRVTLYPVSLKFLGTSGANDDQIAVGQAFTASIERSSIPADPADKYTWSKPSGGAPFANYDPTALLDQQFTAFVVPTAPTTTSISCYFAKPTTSTVTCVFHSGALGVDITVPRKVTPSGPVRTSHGKDCGTMMLRPSELFPTELSLFGVTFNAWDPTTQAMVPVLTGMYAVDRLADPSFLSGGKFAYLQLADVNNITNGTPHPKKGLDGGFPYTSEFNTNSGHTESMDDTPGGNVHSTIGFSYKKDGIYTAHLMYKPSASAAGPSVYVPIYKLDWEVHGSCNYSITGWTSQDLGSKIVKDGDDFDFDDDYFPHWSIVVPSS